MASSSSGVETALKNTNALSNNAAFMDKYSRQIGAFGMEAMSKLIQLKVCEQMKWREARFCMICRVIAGLYVHCVEIINVQMTQIPVSTLSADFLPSPRF